MDKRKRAGQEIWEIPNIPENTSLFETVIDWEKEEKDLDMGKNETLQKANEKP